MCKNDSLLAVNIDGMLLSFFVFWQHIAFYCLFYINCCACYFLIIFYHRNNYQLELFAYFNARMELICYSFSPLLSFLLRSQEEFTITKYEQRFKIYLNFYLILFLDYLSYRCKINKKKEVINSACPIYHKEQNIEIVERSYLFDSNENRSIFEQFSQTTIAKLQSVLSLNLQRISNSWTSCMAVDYRLNYKRLVDVDQDIIIKHNILGSHWFLGVNYLVCLKSISLGGNLLELTACIRNHAKISLI